MIRDENFYISIIILYYKFLVMEIDNEKMIQQVQLRMWIS